MEKETYTTYFQFNELTNSTKCLVADCRSYLKGWNTSNLKRHLKMQHKSKYDALGLDNPRAENRSGAIVLKINVVREASIEMVTINGLPFSFLDCSGYRRICDSLYKALNMSINSHTIGEIVGKRSNDIKHMIKLKVKHKLVSVMLDIVKKYNRSILGIRIQFVENGIIETYTIAMHRLERRHTAKNLCDILNDTLLKFRIDPLQIISITTDNAKNMVNISTHMNEIAANADDCIILENIPDILADSEMDSVLCDEEYLKDLIAGAASTFAQDKPSIQYVNRVNCAVHTLQLAVNDVLHLASIQGEINAYRDVCKKLRATLLAAELSKTGSKVAVIDQETRWNSTFEMVC